MQFYVLDPGPTGRHEVARTDFLDDADSVKGNAPTCSSCGRYIGPLAWLPPYRVELETWGKEYGDFAFSGAPGWFLVSERFRTIYEEEKLRGLSEFASVEILNIKHYEKRLDRPPVYFKVDVIRSNAALDVEASGKEYSEPVTLCPSCLLPKNGSKAEFLRQARIVIRPDTWQGENIFIARGGSRFLVDERFRDICEKHQVKNAVFLPAEEYEIDFYPSESKQLLKYLRKWDDRDQHRELRQDGYRALASVLGTKIGFHDFDPDTDIDKSLIEAARKRLAKEGLWPPQKKK